MKEKLLTEEEKYEMEECVYEGAEAEEDEKEIATGLDIFGSSFFSAKHMVPPMPLPEYIQSEGTKVDNVERLLDQRTLDELSKGFEGKDKELFIKLSTDKNLKPEERNDIIMRLTDNIHLKFLQGISDAISSVIEKNKEW